MERQSAGRRRRFRCDWSFALAVGPTAVARGEPPPPGRRRGGATAIQVDGFNPATAAQNLEGYGDVYNENIVFDRVTLNALKPIKIATAGTASFRTSPSPTSWAPCPGSFPTRPACSSWARRRRPESPHDQVFAGPRGRG